MFGIHPQKIIVVPLDLAASGLHTVGLTKQYLSLWETNVGKHFNGFSKGFFVDGKTINL